MPGNDGFGAAGAGESEALEDAEGLGVTVGVTVGVGVGSGDALGDGEEDGGNGEEDGENADAGRGKRSVAA